MKMKEKKDLAFCIFNAISIAIALLMMVILFYGIIKLATIESQIDRRSQIERYVNEAEVVNVDDASKSEGFGYIDMSKAVENNTVHTPDGRQAKTTDVVNNGYVYSRYY